MGSSGGGGVGAGQESRLGKRGTQNAWTDVGHGRRGRRASEKVRWSAGVLVHSTTWRGQASAQVGAVLIHRLSEIECLYTALRLCRVRVEAMWKDRQITFQGPSRLCWVLGGCCGLGSGFWCQRRSTWRTVATRETGNGERLDRCRTQASEGGLVCGAPSRTQLLGGPKQVRRWRRAGGRCARRRVE